MAAILQLVRGWDRVATENIVTNPSVETALTGWDAGTGGIGSNTQSRSNTQSKFGSYSTKVIFGSVVANSILVAYPLTLEANETYRFSCWVWVQDGTTAAEIYITDGSTFAGSTDTVISKYVKNTDPFESWVYLETEFVLAADAIGIIQVYADGVLPTAGDVTYVDGLQCVKSNSTIVYCDGDQPGCAWTGTPHASTSTRAATSRTTIDLLNDRMFHLKEVTPMVPEYRGGGTYRSSPFADGRRLIDTKYENVIENYNLVAWASDQDRMAEITQNIRQLLIQATQYWTQSWEDTPVWIKAKADKETNARYALIINGQILQDNNHWSQPFLQPGCTSVMDDWDMTLERGFWMENEPTEGTPVAISAVESYAIGAEVSRPEDGDDDGYAASGVWTSNASPDSFGNNTAIAYSTACRFPNVNVPNGAVITSAYILFTPNQTLSSTTVTVDIAAEDADDPAQITNFADFSARTRATAVAWANVPTFTADVQVSSPDIAATIQDVVDRSGWASGQAMNIFVDDNGSSANAWRRYYSYNQGNGGEPVLVISYTDTRNRGNVDSDGTREPTTRNEVFVANKRNIAQITHVFHYDASASTNRFSDNLVGAATPASLLPATPAASDYVYFGIDTSLDDSGPFCSLVFDIGTPAIYTGAATLDWEYWDSAAWSALGISGDIQDNTDDGTGPFTRSGAGSLHWFVNGDWATTTVNGVTGYWVRAAVNLGGGTISAVPTQQNRDIYTVVWPYIEIQSGVVPGDIAALAKYAIMNQGDNAGPAAGSGPGLYTDRIIMGSRRVNRGDEFVVAINLAQPENAQNPDNITVTIPDVGSSWITSINVSAVGQNARFGTSGNRVVITIAAPLSGHYEGRFRAFMRGISTKGGAGTQSDVTLSYKTGSGGTTSTQPAAIYVAGAASRVLVDFGIVDIDLVDSVADEIEFTLTCALGAGVILDGYDFWLIPVDEWAGDIQATELTDDSRISGRYRLNVDEITSPKKRHTHVIDNTNALTANYLDIVSKEVAVPKDERVRVYFLSVCCDIWSIFEQTHSIQLETVARYLSLRGAG
jgi:hypothetical protein